MTPVVGRLLRNLLKTIEVEDVDLILPKEALTSRDPIKENIALENGYVPKPTEFEDMGAHLQVHTARRNEIAAEDPNDPRLGYFDQHIQETMAMAQQMQQAQQGQAPQTDQLGGARPGGQQATALGAAQGNQGVPGAAAPGPGAAPGRPA